MLLTLAGTVSVRAEDQIRRVYSHGMPYGIAVEEALTRHAGELLDVLRSPDAARYWSNAAKVLGFAGGILTDLFARAALLGRAAATTVPYPAIGVGSDH